MFLLYYIVSLSICFLYILKYEAYFADILPLKKTRLILVKKKTIPLPIQSFNPYSLFEIDNFFQITIINLLSKTINMVSHPWRILSKRKRI